MQRLFGVDDSLVIVSAQTPRHRVETENGGGVGIDHRRTIDRGECQVMVARQGGAHRARNRQRQRNVGAAARSLPAPVAWPPPGHPRSPPANASDGAAGGTRQRARWRSGRRGPLPAPRPTAAAPPDCPPPSRRRPPARRAGSGRRRRGRLRLAPSPFNLRDAQHRCDRADHAFGNLVLQVEAVFEGAVEAVGP